jgi:hypothetical protein
MEGLLDEEVDERIAIPVVANDGFDPRGCRRTVVPRSGC